VEIRPLLNEHDDSGAFWSTRCAHDLDPSQWISRLRLRLFVLSVSRPNFKQGRLCLGGTWWKLGVESPNREHFSTNMMTLAHSGPPDAPTTWTPHNGYHDFDFDLVVLSVSRPNFKQGRLCLGGTWWKLGVESPNREQRSIHISWHFKFNHASLATAQCAW
jgi:hypothetical protein